jgi:excisionase family DNA binding protein
VNEPLPPPDRLMTLPELAGYLQVSRGTVLRLIRDEALPAIRLGRGYRFERATVDMWLRQRTKHERCSQTR